ncbi:hypothetical protein SpCBS45565_g01697 [Spizellomyces sp. 'palustris']|nr:hypothetical protein SpCBS45565_g01697 [Spizellomyces sp. 'palustris']
MESSHTYTIEKYSRLYPGTSGTGDSTGWVFLADKPMGVTITENNTGGGMLRVFVMVPKTVELETHDLSRKRIEASQLIVLQKDFIIYVKYSADNGAIRRFQMKFRQDTDRASCAAVLSRFVAVKSIQPIASRPLAIQTQIGLSAGVSEMSPIHLSPTPSCEVKYEHSRTSKLLHGLRLPTPVSPLSTATNVDTPPSTGRALDYFNQSSDGCSENPSLGSTPGCSLALMSTETTQSFSNDIHQRSTSPSSDAQKNQTCIPSVAGLKNADPTAHHESTGIHALQAACPHAKASPQLSDIPVHQGKIVQSPATEYAEITKTLDNVFGETGTINLDYLSDAGLCSLLRKIMQNKEFQTLLTRIDFDGLKQVLDTYNSL